MFIKRVTITGFKSYGKTTTFDDLSKGLNTIIGFNGSGKSNLYKAIEFVLLDEYAKLTPTERLAVLHEGSESKAKKATIEVVFDNTARKIPINENEVVFKRVVEEDKDEFYVNEKKKSRTDIHNLLESSGFNPQNGYYIVRQGKVNQLATMRDSERYDLICDIAGTKFYDEQKKESLSLLDKTKGQVSQIDDSLNFIKERIDQLEKEKVTLEKFESLQNDRKSIEFILQRRKEEKERKEQEEYTKELDELMTKLMELQSQSKKNKEEIEESKANFEDITKKLNDQYKEKAKQEEIRLDISKKLIKEENNLDITKNQLKQAENSKERLQKKIEEIDNEIITKNQRISELSTKINEISNEIDSNQGFSDDFDPQEAEKEIKTLENSLIENNFSDIDLRSEIEDQKQKILIDKEEIMKNNDEILKLSEEMNSQNMNLIKTEDKISELKSDVKILKEKLDNIIMKFNNKIPYNILVSINKINEEMNNEYSLLCDLIKVKDKKYEKVIETILGCHLFDVIVTNVELSDKLQEIVNNNDEGKVTVFPLENLTLLKKSDKCQKSDNLPNSPNCVRLMDFIEINDDKMKYLCETIFGDIYIVDEIDFDDKNVVNDEGLFIDKNGLVVLQDENYFGVFDLISQKKELGNQLKCKNEFIFTIEEEKSRIQNSIDNIQEKMNELSKEKSKKISKMKDDENYLTSLEQQLTSLHKKSDTINQINNGIKSKIENLRNRIEKSKSDTKRNNKKKSYKAISEQKLKEMKDKMALMSEEKENLMNDIHYKLEVIRHQIKEDVSHLNIDFYENEIEKEEQNYKKHLKENEYFSQRIETIARQIQILEEKSNEIESFLFSLQEKNENNEKDIDFIQKKINIIQKSIKKVSSNHENAKIDEKFVNLTDKELNEKMRFVKKEINGIKYVNYSAKEDFDEFSDKQTKLMEEREKLNENERKINEMISRLDKDRDKSLNETFESVSKHFNEYLSIITNLDVKLKLESESKEVRLLIENVGNVSQLSGGQKSLVAICLVFSMQEIFGAPFYIFDEFDSALDIEHRQNLSKLIKKLSLSSQYIVTTFKSDILDYSDRLFQLSFGNNMSQVRAISIDEALQIINS